MGYRGAFIIYFTRPDSTPLLPDGAMPVRHVVSAGNMALVDQAITAKTLQGLHSRELSPLPSPQSSAHVIVQCGDCGV